ncbi:MAG: short-chain fatty acid transporter [Deltaproteobacteria bacterium]|nr:short-chain fatty acid transporter [Deltaproteobacteria bacterium]
MTDMDLPSAVAGRDRREGILARMALRFTDWSERWIPDAFIFALIATVIAFLAGLWVARPIELVDAWGKGVWELLKFTMQMALILVTGYVVASSRPVYRLIVWLAGRATTPRGAVTMVAVFAMASSWLNWGFSLIFSALLAKEVARRVEGADYRALGAASLLGLGSIWAQGLSGSAALQMATPGALQPRIREIIAHGDLVPGGMIGFGDTIFLWQSLASVAIEVVVVAAIAWLYTPSAKAAVTHRGMGIDLGPPIDETPDVPRSGKPGEWFEHSPLLTLAIVALGGAYVVHAFMQPGAGITSITLDIVILVLLLLGALLHWTPARLMRAVRDATPATWGVILQYPFYAGIAGIITYTHLSERIAHFFVGISTRGTFPPIIALYSAALGIFVPSGGSKWVIEAPYVMQAAHELRVHLGWMVAVYDLGEAVANLVQPFWMLPTLALMGLKARDVMGYTFVVFLVLLPLVLIQVYAFGLTLGYPL